MFLISEFITHEDIKKRKKKNRKYEEKKGGKNKTKIKRKKIMNRWKK